MAQNLMFVNEEVKFKETQIALGYSGKLLDIFKYVDVVKFEIDTFMLDKFW
ncbi:100L [Cherax quadricarinatus iridovirus]|uniref:100L n=1 Tax=Cherax quadricarinatus iridovirus TaxID=2035708 RepID=UPI000BBF95F2|nr:100L [Cherax quadricarinatus iridovirus]ASZ85080.1 100L [Cherax quadricarinatus iridovirus]